MEVRSLRRLPAKHVDVLAQDQIFCLQPNIRAEGFRDSKKTLVLKKVALIRRFWRFTWRV
jgi:hypothetical protein